MLDLIFQPIDRALEIADHIFILGAVPLHHGLLLLVGSDEMGDGFLILVQLEFLQLGGLLRKAVTEVGILSLEIVPLFPT